MIYDEWNWLDIQTVPVDDSNYTELLFICGNDVLA